MAELLVVPLKKPSDVDIAKPLKNLISSTYSTADKPEDYSEAIEEFSKLRNNAVWRVFEKFESSLEVIYSYYDQLCALEGKIPYSEIQIPFKWKDAFDKGSLFIARMSLTVSSFAYEKVCVLFNIAALQSAIAAAQSVESDDGLKLAAKLLQMSAGIFSHLRGTVMSAIQQEPTPDLNPETLGALSSLMLAQAQEVFVHKAIHDQMKDSVIAKLSSQCEELYAEVLKLFQKEMLQPLWEKDWIPTVAGKQAAYHGITHYYQSLVCKANKTVGEEIARLERAQELIKASQTRSGKPTYFQDYLTKIQRNLTEARKDNDFIYHERIPDSKSLPPVGKAQMAKIAPLPEHLSQGFRDLFGNLVPIAVHQALATYEVRKNEIVNTEVMKLRESTQYLNSVLATLNLPAAIEDIGGSGNSIPQSVLDKAGVVQNMGGLSKVESLIADLPEMKQRNIDILNEAERMLREEQESDDQLRQQFKERWTRIPSQRLTETFHTNITKYRDFLEHGSKADNVVKESLQKHHRGISLLSGGEESLKSAVPTATGTSVAASQSSVVSQLKELLEQVETIKAERDAIESELRSVTTDMRPLFLQALAQDGAINEQVISAEHLGRSFADLRRQVAESLQRQEDLLDKIKVANVEFCKEKSGVGAAAQREAILKELAAAFDAYKELQDNLKAGMKFYNDLTDLLVAFQNKVSDFCFARKTEKEELMKDLTQSPTRQNLGPMPTIPPAAGSEAKREPPPRPPPPSVAPPQQEMGTSGLPYPSYPVGMPVPYGATTAAPYPTYIPPPVTGGFNPYAAGVGGVSMPYPQQGYVYQFPQPPFYQNFPQQPAQQQQQPPPQNRQW